MKNFIIYDISGTILRAGTVPDFAFSAQKLKDTEYLIEGICDGQNDTIDITTKQIIPGGRIPDPVDMDYRKARRDAYPYMFDQLDMLWHGMHTGQTPKVEPFYSRLKVVKDSYPKDNSVVPGSVIIYTT